MPVPAEVARWVRRASSYKALNNSLKSESFFTTKTVLSYQNLTASRIRQMHGQTPSFLAQEDFMSKLLLYIATDELKQEQWKALFHPDMLRSFLCILQEESYYTSFPEDKAGMHHLVLTYQVIDRMATHAKANVRCYCGAHKAAHAPWATYVLEELPAVWRFLQDKLSCEIYIGDSDLSDHLRHYTAKIGLWYFHDLYLERHNRNFSSDLVDSYLDIAIKCWYWSKGSHVGEYWMMILAAYGAWNAQAADRTIERIIRGVIPPHILAPRLGVALRSEDMLSSELMEYHTMLTWVITHDDLKRSLLSISFLSNLLCAAERQLCSGKDILSWSIVRYTAMRICEMMSLHRRGVWGDSVVLSSFIYRLVLCLSQAIVLANMSSEDNVVHDTDEQAAELKLVAALYWHYFGEEGFDLSEEDARALQGAWRRAAVGLQGLVRNHPDTPLAAVLWAGWQELGRRGHLDTATVLVIRPRRKRSKNVGCAWEDCLCSGRRPGHALRACTRCRKAFYCSTKCQKKDWKEGDHRGECFSHVPYQ